ncbi:unnamed protein product [Miscanthus lutarioriparius]|uniref:Uncharacterized protein n=1 Tax=Miscanthus lutarioriparius TaxID=422564 RepID=A0A811RG04_9POAL|nr:unnamed protein product [Miscanthus lutarioriparius]
MGSRAAERVVVLVQQPPVHVHPGRHRGSRRRRRRCRLRRGGGRRASVGSGAVAVLVGSSRRRYVISAEHLSHPLIAALIDDGRHKDQPIAVNCEVVLFDHLLWMLDNAVDLHGEGDDDAMRELAQLYAC